MTQLSPHFALSEFLSSQTATRLKIPNGPTAAEIEAMRLLCIHVLEPVREHYGVPVRISSGFRSQALNDATPGSSNTSQHRKGEAADIEIAGVSNVDLAQWIHAHLNYDQLILEFYTPGQPSSGWVHVSYREPYRNMELTAIRARSKLTGRLKTVYLPGIRP